MDVEYYDREEKGILEQSESLREKLLSSKEAWLFKKNMDREIKLTSNPDLRKLLFEYLGNVPFKLTDSGAESVDAETMDNLDIPFANDLVEMRKLNRIVHTYFDQIRREAHEGKVHVVTNLHVPRTYRPSLSEPNLANIPKRDKFAKIMVRRGIRVPGGYCMMANDYSGIEIHGLEWYSRDQELLKYLEDTDSDMHRDQTQLIFNLSPAYWKELDSEATDLLRFYGKNQLVFPLFYGSWHEPCAANLWRFCADLPIGASDITVKEHIRMPFSSFKEHVKELEYEFWKTFHGVRQWQDDLSNEYQKNGYIETYLGFRYRGWLTRNQLYNYKVQGTAFHLLLWSMTELHRMSIRRRWKSYIMWQIYDQLIWALWPPEREEVLAACDEVMVGKARERFEWINTPIRVDHEITQINGTFADLSKVGASEDNYDMVDVG